MIPFFEAISPCIRHFSLFSNNISRFLNNNEKFLEHKPNAHPSSKISKIKLYTVTFESFLSRPCCLRWMGLQYSAYNFLRCVRPSRSWSAGGGGDVGSPSFDQGWYYIPPITMLRPGLLLHSTNHNKGCYYIPPITMTRLLLHSTNHYDKVAISFH